MVLTAALPALLAPAAHGGERADELPNLVPLPVADIAIRSMNSPNPDAGISLRFEASTANKGEFALDLFGQPDSVTTESAAASQCVEWVADRVCARRQPVGRFLWHASHGHYHFEDFALYELRRFRRDGSVDLSPKGLVTTSGKVSFCVIDVEQDREPDSVFYVLPNPLYYSCFTGTGFQGISPGWRDVYSSGTAGQSFPQDELIPGRLAIVIYTDPENRLFETDEEDNVSVTGIEISRDLSKVDVFCKSEPGSVVCDQPMKNSK